MLRVARLVQDWRCRAETHLSVPTDLDCVFSTMLNREPDPVPPPVPRDMAADVGGLSRDLDVVPGHSAGTLSSHLACTDKPHSLHVFPCLLNPQIED
jgi:hypothetical protein